MTLSQDSVLSENKVKKEFKNPDHATIFVRELKDLKKAIDVKEKDSDYKKGYLDALNQVLDIADIYRIRETS